MDADIAKKLREPFPAATVGKLPRVTCKACSNSPARHCDRHERKDCKTCGNWISTAHMHLDYVGHAAVTDRLLQADAGWTWEPLAFATDGLPALDRNAGLWIRLTVAGVTRLGYGHADGKQGADAVKEAIGDALRNGAMRFGVGLDLWHKDGPLVQDDEPAPAPPPKGQADPAPSNAGADAARKRLRETCADNGWDMDVVAATFAEAKGVPLREATDVASITKFREYLFTRPQTELQPAAAAALNGAQA